jgi:ribosomal-protein-alanine N-acetyltransferase
MIRPPFEHFPELESPRILMRQLLPSDAAFVRDIMVYNGKPAESITDAVAMTERIENDSQNGNTVNWVLVHKTTNEAMGTIGYYRGFANDTGEIGFIMKPEFHGNGYMTEALKLVTEFGWKTLQLRRVIAITKLLNEPAVRLLERCGFRYVCPFDEVYSEFEHTGDPI